MSMCTFERSKVSGRGIQYLAGIKGVNQCLPPAYDGRCVYVASDVFCAANFSNH